MAVSQIVSVGDFFIFRGSILRILPVFFAKRQTKNRLNVPRLRVTAWPKRGDFFCLLAARRTRVHLAGIRVSHAAGRGRRWMLLP